MIEDADVSMHQSTKWTKSVDRFTLVIQCFAETEIVLGRNLN